MPQIKLGAVAVNPFVRRQTAGSPYSHYNGTLEELAKWAEIALLLESDIRDGYREGVKLVTINPGMELQNDFMSSTVALDTQIGLKISQTHLRAKYIRRQDGEEPFIQVVADWPKTKTGIADLVIYHHTLVEGLQPDDDDAVAEWQLIAILARTQMEPEPMDPVTMARNFLERPGGTKATYTAEEFAKSIWYWSRHVLTEPLK